MKTLFLIISLFTITGAAYGSDYYVSNDGSDSHPGTKARPWATLEKVSKSAHASDRIFLHRGSTWTAQFTLPADRLVIDAYGDGPAPVIDGSSLYFSILMVDRSHITIRNLVLVNAANDCLRIQQKTGTTHDILIENNVIRGCGHNGVNFAPSNADIAAGRLPHDIRVLHNVMSDCGNAAVQVRAQADIGDNRIASNTIDNAGTRYATNAISLGYVHNIIIEHNTITNTRSTDIDGSGVTADYLKSEGGNLYGSGTVIRYNSVECPSPPVNEQQAGIAVWYQPNVQIYDNTVKNCNDGIRVSGNVSSGYDIHDNTIVAARKRGAAFTSSAAGGQFHHNTLSGTNDGDVGIWVNRGSSAPVETYNNIRDFHTGMNNGNNPRASLHETDNH